jgi:hypothetical protein
MITKVLPGGVRRVVHVIAKTLKENLDHGAKKPMVGVRDWNNLSRMYIYRRVDILGPSTVMEIDQPLPGTDGRGICPLITEAALMVYMDEDGENQLLHERRAHAS